jgi:hypothetical protein
LCVDIFGAVTITQMAIGLMTIDQAKPDYSMAQFQKKNFQ